jgi:hypothetical protein
LVLEKLEPGEIIFFGVKVGGVNHRSENGWLPDCTLIDVARGRRHGILEWDFFPLDNALLSAVPPNKWGARKGSYMNAHQAWGRKPAT